VARFYLRTTNGALRLGLGLGFGLGQVGTQTPRLTDRTSKALEMQVLYASDLVYESS